MRSIRLAAVALLALVTLPLVAADNAQPAPRASFAQPAISPDGGRIAFVSGGAIWEVPATGGAAHILVADNGADSRPLYSPQGDQLAFVSDATGDGDIYVLDIASGKLVRVTYADGRDELSGWSHDGKWIYFSSERAATVPGHAQCFRMRPDGTGIEQLTFDARVNWFPHLSPDGRAVTFISFPTGTTGHPPNKDVILRHMRPDGSEIRDLLAIFGGQGTMNVNSWAPDSRRFAFVAYPVTG